MSQNQHQMKETTTSRRTEMNRAQRSRRRLFSRAESVLVGKDIQAIWGAPAIRTLLLSVPILGAVLLPAAAYIAINLLPEAPLPSPLIQALLSQSSQNSKQIWMETVTKLLCPLFYLCIPIVCGVVSASCSFVGEKEGHTLESLFLSALPARSIYNAKVTACTLLSLLISWISFGVFAITVSILDLLLGAPFFLSLEWLLLALLITPALVFFSVVFVTLLLIRAQSVQEALETSGYLMVPLTILYLLQFSGLYYIGPLPLLILFILLAIASVVIFNVSGARFNAESLFTKEFLDR